MAAPRRVSALDWRGSDAEPAGALVIRGARVVEPREDIDAIRDVVVRDGEIAEIVEVGSGEAEGAEVIEAEGFALFPAFFDPHVHLRTPGREDKEDVETGSRAAAAGGFCGIVAMANTEPAGRHRRRHRRAARAGPRAGRRADRVRRHRDQGHGGRWS